MNILPIIALGVIVTTAFASDDHVPHGCGKHAFSIESDNAEIFNSEARIVGGYEATYGEFPWLAILNYNDEMGGLFSGIKCGGVVINNRFILTAAHCLHLQPYTLTSVWLGVRKRSQINSVDYQKVQKFGIAGKFVHPNYNPVTFEHDIALIKLDNIIKYTNYVKEICLPTQGEDLPRNGTLLRVAGWGQPSRTPVGEYSDHKLIIQVPIFSYDECTKRLGYRIRDEQICAEGDFLTGTCWGDGGAPFMEHRHKGYDTLWYATGIVSATTGCGAMNKPLVHTRVSSYVGWILQTINK